MTVMKEHFYTLIIIVLTKTNCMTIYLLRENESHSYSTSSS